MTVGAGPDLADVQGNLLRGYRKPHVRHLVLAVSDPAAARRWLAEATSGDGSRAPRVTDARPWDERPASCVNVGLSAAGLTALGVSARSLATFPHEFVDGMASRAVKLGDTGPSDPAGWSPEWRDRRLHLVVTVHADDEATRAAVADRVLGFEGGAAFSELAHHDGSAFPGGTVHFGYRDSISQPRFLGVHDPADRADDQPLVEVGAVLLGHPNPVENVLWEVPDPPVLGRDGAFNAFRVLEQQVDAFEAFLTEAADRILTHPRGDQVLPAGVEATWDPPVTRHEALRELVAAKLLGRWRNGVPLVLSPTTPTPDPPVTDAGLNAFGYGGDPDGLACPVGSHARRCNPRDARIVQRNTNHSRRLVRRGIPYGPPYDPARPDGTPRGLLGAFVCASLIAQFEAVQYDWANLGLQDPRITGTNDPLIGNNDPDFSAFHLPVGDGTIGFTGFPRFVHTRGGAYLFVPSLPALRHLAGTGR